jgi:CubicO group peptidase (beta-lactamase class C family)
MNSLFRNLSILVISGIFLYACGSSSSEKKSGEDSLNYYPPTPQTINKKDFREMYRAIKAFYDTSLLATGFNGGILVAKGGTVVFETYHGSAHLNGKDSITAATPFHIASTTKTFTATGILRLIEQGKLELNDSLQKFFPAFPYKGITVKMLLSQRSGLPNYMNVLEKMGWNKKQRITNKQVLYFFIAKKPNLYYASGTRFNYSNTNFVLLALIIEKVSGKTYKQFITETFFKPLQMNHSFVFEWKDSTAVTPSYRWNGALEPFTFLDETVGDKNIYSTPHDLLKWDQALYTDQLISKTIKDSAFHPYSFEKPGIHNYGLGWRMYTLPENKTILYHNGWWHGNNSCFYRVVTDSLSIIILGNKNNKNTYRVKSMIEALTTLRFAYDAEQE